MIGSQVKKEIDQWPLIGTERQNMIEVSHMLYADDTVVFSGAEDHNLGTWK